MASHVDAKEVRESVHLTARLKLSILARLDLMGDSGLTADRLATVAGYSYWRPSQSHEHGNRRVSYQAHSLIDKLLEEEIIERKPIKFEGPIDVKTYRISNAGRKKLAELRILAK
jgi:hypothetical protein